LARLERNSSGCSGGGDFGGIDALLHDVTPSESRRPGRFNDNRKSQAFGGRAAAPCNSDYCVSARKPQHAAALAILHGRLTIPPAGPAASGVAEAPIEVVLRNGRVLRVSAAADTAVVARLAAALET
jgi:hypothetical protein